MLHRAYSLPSDYLPNALLNLIFAVLFAVPLAATCPLCTRPLEHTRDVVDLTDISFKQIAIAAP